MQAFLFDLNNSLLGNFAGELTQADRQDGNPKRLLTITFQVPDEHGPALRSAIEELSGELGSRVEGPHSFDREDALTKALCAVGILRAAVNTHVPAEDPYYNPIEQ